MIRRALLVACAAALPSVATAQRGGGSGATKKTELFDRSDAAGPTLRVRDIEDASSIKLLIDKRKDLKLSDAQINALKDAENKAKEKNAPTFKIVDSLVHELKVFAANKSSSEVDKSHAMTMQSGLRNAVEDALASYDALAKEAMTGFDPDQTTKANDFMSERRAESQKQLRQRMGGGGH